MGHHRLIAVVVDAGKISRDLARLTIGGGLFANLRSDGLKYAGHTSARIVGRPGQRIV